MSNINVSLDTIQNYYQTLIEENKIIYDIVQKIEQATIDYQDMMISKAGTLFQEFMISEQERLKRLINENNLNIADKLLNSSTEYNNAINYIKGSVNNGDVR